MRTNLYAIKDAPQLLMPSKISLMLMPAKMFLILSPEPVEGSKDASWSCSASRSTARRFLADERGRRRHFPLPPQRRRIPGDPPPERGGRARRDEDPAH